MSVESANHALFALCFNETKISFYFGKQTVREEKKIFPCKTGYQTRNKVQHEKKKLQVGILCNSGNFCPHSNCCLQSLQCLQTLEIFGKYWRKMTNDKRMMLWYAHKRCKFLLVILTNLACFLPDMQKAYELSQKGGKCI